MQLIPKLREYLIEAFESLCDTMDSWAGKTYKIEKRKIVVERMNAKQLRLDKDAERERVSNVWKKFQQTRKEAQPTVQSSLHQFSSAFVKCPACGGDCSKTIEGNSGCGCLLVILGFALGITIIGFFRKRSIDGL